MPPARESSLVISESKALSPLPLREASLFPVSPSRANRETSASPIVPTRYQVLSNYRLAIRRLVHVLTRCIVGHQVPSERSNYLCCLPLKSAGPRKVYAFCGVCGNATIAFKSSFCRTFSIAESPLPDSVKIKFSTQQLWWE